MEKSATIWKVLAITFFTIAALAVFFGWPAISGRWQNSSSYDSYPLLDPTRNFIAQEHFIVNLQPLREKLRALAQKERPGSISLYFEYLNTGANVDIGKEVRIWPASLPKLPLAMAAIKKVEKGDWQLDTELVLKEEEKDAEFGVLFEKPAGARLSIEVLLQELLTNSDNTAYKVLLDNMTPPDIDAIIAETGLEELFDERGFASAKEYSRLYRALYTSSFLQRKNSSKILEWLMESDFDKYLAGGLNTSVPFAHKWGRNQAYRVFLDSGIVYVPNRPYIITVMIQGDGSPGEEERAAAMMREIGSMVYNYIAAYDRQ